MTATESFLRVFNSDSVNVLTINLSDSSNTWTGTLDTRELTAGTYTLEWFTHNTTAGGDYQTGSNASSSQTLVISARTVGDITDNRNILGELIIFLRNNLTDPNSR